jgi:hypothetical protein
MCNAAHFERRFAELILEPYVDEIQVQQTQQHLEERANDLQRGVVGRHCRQGDESDEVANAASQPLDLLGGIFRRGFHLEPRQEAARASGRATLLIGATEQRAHMTCLMEMARGHWLVRLAWARHQ